MTLYEIDKAIINAFDAAVDAETGEIVDEGAYGDFMQLDMEKDKKIENVGLWIKDLKAEAEAIRAEELLLSGRRRAKENKLEQLKSWLSYALDGERFETAKLRISYRKSQSVEADLDKLPDKYLRFRDPEPDKQKIKDALKAGTVIPGARMVTRQSMIIK